VTPRSKGWLVTAALFTLANTFFAGYAAALGEVMHAGAHVAGMLLGAYAVWRTSARLITNVAPAPAKNDERLEQLQQSVDVVAIEIERLGEAQRFNAKLEAERARAAR
jgi:hypothetical protein